MENQLRAGEEPDNQGERTWNPSHLSDVDAVPPPLQAAYLEARTCQVESRYLEVLRQLQDTRSLDSSQREALQKLVEEALKRELQVKHQVTRYGRAAGQKKRR